MKCPQLDWNIQQLYQVLALNFKGEALAMIKALAAGECEGTRGVTAWCGPTHGGRGSSAQRILGLVGEFSKPQRCVNMSDISSHFELWESPQFESMRSWSSRHRRSRQRCPTVARYLPFPLPSPEPISHVDHIDRRCIQLTAFRFERTVIDRILALGKPEPRSKQQHAHHVQLWPYPRQSCTADITHAGGSSPPLTCPSACTRSSTTRALPPDEQS